MMSRSSGRSRLFPELLVGWIVILSGLASPASASPLTDCTGLADGTPCDDASTCTTGDACKLGVCVGLPVPDGNSCDDGNPCTAGDSCKAGGCAGMLVDNGLRISRLAPGSSTAVINWNLPSGATSSDVVRGRISALPVNPNGVFEVPLVTDDSGTTTYSDAVDPGPGSAFWYLARGGNACGNGPWGFESLRAVATVPEVSNGGCVPDVAASPRFVDNGLTVTDMTTCLEWEKKTATAGLNNVDNLYTWSAVDINPDGTVFTVFFKGLNAASFARHRDWRIPSDEGQNTAGQPEELESIVDDTQFPTLDPIFGPTSPTGYWATSTASSPHLAWYVYFGNGGTFVLGKTQNLRARAVRGGP
jgi:hypothetical protein